METKTWDAGRGMRSCRGAGEDSGVKSEGVSMGLSSTAEGNG